MHEHDFRVELVITGEPDPELGWVMDYGEIDAVFAPLHAELTDACLNDLSGLENPTSEMLAQWIWRRVKPEMPSLSEVRVAETPEDSTRYSEV